MSAKLSIVIPVYNEETEITQCLNNLQLLRQQAHEVIVVDGGSDDDTVSLAKPFCDKIIQSEKSRAIQMNAGANEATGDYYLFLHVDTILPENISELFIELTNKENCWGRFDIELSGKHFMFRVIETCMNIRSRVTGIATGDQVIFISKQLFNDINGFPGIALMEDVAISKKLLSYSRPMCIKDKVISSSRRWEKHGIIRTILKMWLLRILYFFQVDPRKLQKMYS